MEEAPVFGLMDVSSDTIFYDDDFDDFMVMGTSLVFTVAFELHVWI